MPAALLRFALLSLFLLSTWTFTAAAPAAADTAWALHEPGTPPAPGPRLFSAGPTRLECGSYGVFEMDFAGFGVPGGGPTTVASGREEPRDYPLLTAGAPEGRLARDRGNAPLGALAEISVPLPCAGGSCFGRPGAGPWVAVVDWDDWHGWSVGWTVLESSGGTVDAVLFPLDEPSLVRHFGERVTDVHVLTQLCRLAEAVEEPGVSPPVAVNLSFGRFSAPRDARDDRCDPSTLACQIGRVLDHLIDRSAAGLPNPTLVAASAGNHRELLFPASYASVVSVGALDTQRLHKFQHADAAWETPRRVDALFPGHGLCLRYPAPYPRVSAHWPAPPGSSYATAVMTGWLAPSLAAGPLEEPEWGRWAPAAFCRGRHCSWLATKGGRPVGKPNRAAEGLLNGSSPQGDSPCGEASEGGVVLVRPLGDPIPLAALDALPFPQVSPQLHQPTPEPTACVPCEDRYTRNRNKGRQLVGSGDSSLAPATPALPGRRLAPASAPGRPPSGEAAAIVGSGQAGEDLVPGIGAMGRRRGDGLAVTLWAGQALDPDLSLEAVYLRLGILLYPVQLGRRHLDELASGAVDVLEIDLGPMSLTTTSQPSLVWVMEGPAAAGGTVRFWTSTPILLRDR